MQGDVGELALVEGSPPAIVRNSEENLPGDRGTPKVHSDSISGFV